jgi:hypothetical protein
MEHTFPECEALVQRVTTFVLLSLARGRQVLPALRKVYAVDRLVVEVNSSRTFESYLRWAPLDELATIVEDMQAVGLKQVARITRRALRTGFSERIPATEVERECWVASWSQAQRNLLEGLADYVEDSDGELIRSLAAYVLTLAEDCSAGREGLH